MSTPIESSSSFNYGAIFGSTAVLIAVGSSNYYRVRKQRRLRALRNAQLQGAPTVTNNAIAVTGDDNAQRTAQSGFSEARFANYSTQYSSVGNPEATSGTIQI